MVVRTFKLLFRPSFLLTWILITWLIFSATVWFQNLHLIYFALESGAMSLTVFVRFLFSLYGSLLTNFTPLAAVMTGIIAMLFGLNATLLFHYIKKVRRLSTNVELVGVTSMGGLVSGILGIGCSSCGSIVVTAILSQIGAAGFLLWLPLRGAEFNFIAIGLLLYALYVLIQKIHAPLVCLDDLPVIVNQDRNQSK